jgi:hypothetical protein
MFKQAFLDDLKLKAEDLNTVRPFIYEHYVHWFNATAKAPPETWGNVSVCVLRLQSGDMRHRTNARIFVHGLSKVLL